MPPLASGLDYIDLNFLGQPGVIATVLLHGSEGVALIDPGPSTTLPHLKASLAERGFSLKDVRAILLTHIHLDHAGCTGVLIDSCPNATVFVHENGAPHLVDPSKLVASASRLYAPDMERLWGEIRPVPAARVKAMGTDAGRTDVGRTEVRSADVERTEVRSADVGRTEVRSADVERTEVRSALRLPPLAIVGHELEVAWTPGHAWHHVSYFSQAARIAFVGDTAGVCRQSGRVVLPPTPPPDIDLEAWHTSTELILSWNPDTLFLTHFGPQASPRVHFQDLWKRMAEWSGRVKALLGQPGSDDDRARAFTTWATDELVRATSPDEARAYQSAARFDFSWTGLARYWKKRS